MLRPELADVRGIVFDLDGTLVDTFGDLQAAANHVRGLLGLRGVPVEEVRRHVGRGVGSLIRGVLPGAPPDAIESLAREFVRYYGRHALDTTRPYPGVEEALRALAGMPLAVLSNKPEAETRAILAGLGLSGHFAAVFGGDSLGVMKPDPAALVAAVHALHVPAARSLMVGDSDVDIETARGAGIRVVRVATGLADSSVLAPDLEVADLRGLLYP